jgi:hypothetical protein
MRHAVNATDAGVRYEKWSRVRLVSNCQERVHGGHTLPAGTRQCWGQMQIQNSREANWAHDIMDGAFSHFARKPPERILRVSPNTNESPCASTRCLPAQALQACWKTRGPSCASMCSLNRRPADVRASRLARFGSRLHAVARVGAANLVPPGRGTVTDSLEPSVAGGIVPEQNVRRAIAKIVTDCNDGIAGV